MKIQRTGNTLRHAGAGFIKQESGSVYIEIAVAVLCFLGVIFSAMEVCSAAYAYTVLADAANEGVHYAVFNSTDETGAINTVKTYAADTLHDVSDINVSLTYPDGAATPPDRVAVTVTYQYVPYLSTFMTNPPAMHAYAEGRLLR
jgi:Flp pilus assembly protein TadG